jgi:ribonucleoside-diphosphate reductase alpha chain
MTTKTEEIVATKEEKIVSDKVFSREEVSNACLEYFGGDELAAGVWPDKYAMKNKSGELIELSPTDMHWRMANEFGRIETKNIVHLNGKKTSLSEYGQKREHLTAERIFNYFDKFKHIVPQGSVMAMLGNKHMIGSLSNCIVIPELFDSYGGIMFADQQLAQLFKRRCGVGVDISNLRPENSTTSNAAGTSTGAISFMERFSSTTREVAQNGRRGALMISIDIAHPDVEKFITIKQDLKKVTGANISVKLSDEFMLAVKDNTEYTHKWPIGSATPTHTKTIKARDLWNTIIKCAHNTAEPGLIFWDRQHWYSTSSIYPQYKNVSTNPCSEIGMGGNDSCRLIAVNMFGSVIEPFTKNAEFDHKKFYEVVYEGQRINDDLVDLELEAVTKILKKIDSDPEPEYIKDVERHMWKALYENGKNGRRTGLGFTALSDTIAALGYKIDSNKAMEIVESIMKTKCQAEFDSSIDMAIERGTFVGFDTEIENKSEFVQMMKKEFPDIYERMMKYGRRNVSLSTVAPCGSLSILTQTSSGIEPAFMLSYKRRRKINTSDKNVKIDFTDAMGDKWQEYEVFHPKFKMWKDVTGKSDVEESPYKGACAGEIDWTKRVKLQSIVQKYITHSISSTINLPENVLVETVAEIYMKSWELGLKGITVYRDKSRSGVLISNDEKKKETPIAGENHAPKRPKNLNAQVLRFNNGGEKWVGFIGLYKDPENPTSAEYPYEIFTGLVEDFPLPDYVENGVIRREKEFDKKKDAKVSRYDFVYTDKDGEEITLSALNKAFVKEYWNYAKMISGLLRHKMPLVSLINVIETLNLGEDALTTWKAGVIRMIKKYIKDGTKAKDRLCTNCGDPEGLIFQEGCLICKGCGNAKCG